jgi:hypothetical protein
MGRSSTTRAPWSQKLRELDLRFRGLGEQIRIGPIALFGQASSQPAGNLGAKTPDISDHFLEAILHISTLQRSHLALVAQGIEQRFPKPFVAGSIPAGGI